jgi:uracil-DNA glycosylase family 4
VSAWTDHVDKWKDCTLCPLAQQRSRICIARGTLPCSVLFVGEAPGASEDAIGLPFVGPAGHLLDQIIERSIPKNVDYALTNLVCCFPAEAKAEGTNKPHHTEILSCRPRLVEFVNIARPSLIVCVGSLVKEYIDHNDTVHCIDITHPAAILRMPLAQKNMAAQRMVVIIRNAVDNLGNVIEFKRWGQRYANIKAEKRRAETASGDDSPGDDIPF